jgi:hypothetical protein
MNSKYPAISPFLGGRGEEKKEDKRIQGNGSIVLHNCKLDVDIDTRISALVERLSKLEELHKGEL